MPLREMTTKKIELGIVFTIEHTSVLVVIHATKILSSYAVFSRRFSHGIKNNKAYLIIYYYTNSIGCYLEKQINLNWQINKFKLAVV